MRTSPRIRSLAIAAAASVLAACGDGKPAEPSPDGGEGAAYIGGIERIDARLDGLIDPQARPEVLANGYSWAEGPLWVTEGDFLIFSDVPQNRIHAWSEAEGAREWLRPSGFTSAGDGPGSNGLLFDADGYLVLCQHGDRRIARLDAPLWDPVPEFETVADQFEGRRLNSPNDAAYRSDGSLWFTDPPYGLDGGDASPEKDLPFNGVFVLRDSGELEVVTDTLTRPNGIAFSPDERTVYVANSDPERSYWAAYSLDDSGRVLSGRMLLDATGSSGAGLPDGLKVDVDGNLFATGPGGVWVIAPDGTHLGTILTEVATANAAFGGADGRMLYLTSSSYLLRVPLRTRGAVAAVRDGTS